jgi:hypothetical protein
VGGGRPLVEHRRCWWRRRLGWRREAEHREQLPDLADATLQQLDRRDELVAQPRSGSIRATWASSAVGSNTLATVAVISASLSGNARNRVPSATPAASAICDVVTSRPYIRRSGNVAAMMLARRASGDSGAARVIHVI